MEIKTYYMRSWRMQLVGIIILSQLLVPFLLGWVIEGSVKQAARGYWDMVAGGGIASLYIIFFLVLFAFLGVFFIRRSRRFILCRLTDKALHHLKFHESKGTAKWGIYSMGSQYLSDVFFSPNFIAIPYTDIASISLEGGFWSGTKVYVTRKSTEKKEWIRAAAASNRERKELVAIVSGYLTD